MTSKRIHSLTQSFDAPLSDPILVALSGGVDSALAALLLCQAGYQVAAVFMKNWDEDDGTPHCTAQDDFDSASQVCEILGIKLYQISFSPEYFEQVFEPMLAQYRLGLTPNPDIACNRHIKFGALLQHAQTLGYKWLATGHYARLDRSTSGQHRLLRARDADKDQSYFLHQVPEAAFTNVLFPIGSLLRAEVRQLAKQQHLPNWNRKGSTGICFIGERNFANFLNSYLELTPGDITDTDGTTLGKHQGACLYTPGQRKGLGLGGIQSAAEAPWYVVDTHTDTNQVVVTQGEDPALYYQRLLLKDMNWIGMPPRTPCKLTARFRYRQTDIPCQLDEQDGLWTVDFAEAQRTPACGQFCVFYDDQRCLGGGMIVQRFH
ncbi:MAG: tRNA 2-thiouridine(34) synthase MnmA [Gammaproteobacteria bacterium]